MKAIKNFFLFITGHTYSNLSRLFLRLFVGLMFLQVGMRQILHSTEIAANVDAVLSLPSETWVLIIAVAEVLCAACIIMGFLMRIAIVPSLAVMFYAEVFVFKPDMVSNSLFAFQPGYPMMFIGVFVFLLLSGPGKVSIEYLIAVHFDREKEEDEVLENA